MLRGTFVCDKWCSRACCRASVFDFSCWISRSSSSFRSLSFRRAPVRYSASLCTSRESRSYDLFFSISNSRASASSATRIRASYTSNEVPFSSDPVSKSSARGDVVGTRGSRSLRSPEDAELLRLRVFAPSRLNESCSMLSACCRYRRSPTGASPRGCCMRRDASLMRGWNDGAARRPSSAPSFARRYRARFFRHPRRELGDEYSCCFRSIISLLPADISQEGFSGRFFSSVSASCFIFSPLRLRFWSSAHFCCDVTNWSKSSRAISLARSVTHGPRTSSISSFSCSLRLLLMRRVRCSCHFFPSLYRRSSVSGAFGSRFFGGEYVHVVVSTTSTSNPCTFFSVSPALPLSSLIVMSLPTPARSSPMKYRYCSF
eukprot:Rhum_TRINITY_DN19371_c0_g1::Rhum_TRINITY_DN19371_c0_g1_i1::g.169903::m.169903